MRFKVLCGAHARSTGQPCKAKALANGRCRLHGGLSTGPSLSQDARLSGKKPALEWLQDSENALWRGFIGGLMVEAGSTYRTSLRPVLRRVSRPHRACACGRVLGFEGSALAQLLERRVPKADACQRCQAGYRRGNNCPIWFLNGVVRALEQR